MSDVGVVFANAVVMMIVAGDESKSTSQSGAGDVNITQSHQLVSSDFLAKCMLNITVWHVNVVCIRCI